MFKYATSTSLCRLEEPQDARGQASKDQVTEYCEQECL